MAYNKLQSYHIDMAQYLKPPAHPKLLLTKIVFYGTASGISTGFVPAWLYSMLTDQYKYLIYAFCLLFGLFIMHSLYVKIAFQMRFTIRGETEKIKNNVFGQRVIRASALICCVITTYAGLQKFLNIDNAGEIALEKTKTKVEQLEIQRNKRVAEFDSTIAFYESIGRVTYYAQPERRRRDAYVDSMNAVIALNESRVNYATIERAEMTDYTAAIRYFSFGIEFVYVLIIIMIGLVWYYIIDECFVTESQVYSAFVYATALQTAENKINQSSTDAVNPASTNPSTVNVDGKNDYTAGKEEKIRQIIDRIKNGDVAILRIADMLNTTKLSYKEIGALESIRCSDTWVGFVQEALRRLGENERQ